MSSNHASSGYDLRLARLEAWLETLRGPDGTQGYGGPVAHWWRQSLLYTGPGCDWRYEGIILGYLELWKRSGEQRWLAKAKRAGDDLLHSQLAGGHYPASAFEINPASGGTPHEAAASLGLLGLAAQLRDQQDSDWERYLQAAEKTLRGYYLEQLWDEQARSFRDHPNIASFVPNKAATACQALFAWSRLSGDGRWAEQYALPNLERVLAHQITETGPLQGAIAQNSFGKRIIPKYMPYYIARCVPGLVEGYIWSNQERFLQAARLAMDFVLRQRTPHGGLLPVIYPHGQSNHWPQWVAGVADVLLAAEQLAAYGIHEDLEALEQWLLNGQDATGGIQTASGFASQAGGKPNPLPDFRDVLHVAGWCDKAFRYLAGKVSGKPLPLVETDEFDAEVIFRDARLYFHEDASRVEGVCAGQTVYLWIKGERWAREAAPAFWLQ